MTPGRTGLAAIAWSTKATKFTWSAICAETAVATQWMVMLQRMLQTLRPITNVIASRQNLVPLASQSTTGRSNWFSTTYHWTRFWCQSLVWAEIPLRLPCCLVKYVVRSPPKIWNCIVDFVGFQALPLELDCNDNVIFWMTNFVILSSQFSV